MKPLTWIAAAAVLFITSPASAQSKAEKVFDKIYPYTVAAEIGVIIFDGATSSSLEGKGYKEKTRILRDERGYFSAKKYYAMNGSIAAGKVALMRLFPTLRPYFAALNLGIAAGHAKAGARNISLARRQIKLSIQFSR